MPNAGARCNAADEKFLRCLNLRLVRELLYISRLAFEKEPEHILRHEIRFETGSSVLSWLSAGSASSGASLAQAGG